MADSSVHCMDLKTPRNVYLTAYYKRSFAYHTVKNRLPIILTQTIDGLVRNKIHIGNDHGEDVLDELKHVIGELSKLKYEIQTNKPLRELQSNANDVKFYNNYLQNKSNQEGTVTYFTTIWLLAECYMYRRIRESFEMTSILKDYDPFLSQKQESYKQALPLINKLGGHYSEMMKENDAPNKDVFVELLGINLWGNKCDLSLSNGVTGSYDDLFNLKRFESHVLCDDSDKVWNALLTSHNNSNIVDIVFDNAGYELFTDLCLADYLITTKLASKIRLYVKTIPWFISDVMIHDFHWLLAQLTSIDTSEKCLHHMAKRWTKHLKNKSWIVVEDDFWTLPIEFASMAKVRPDLYNKIASAKLVIFKGDLNYRKLFGEKNWDPTTPVDVALQGFHPTKLCTLRTIKADIVCGLPPGTVEQIDNINEKWMETGDYGLIQFSEKIVSI